MLDMVPRSARLSFVAGSVAVIADASALAVIAAPCAIQGSQGILGTSSRSNASVTFDNHACQLDKRRAPLQNVYAETHIQYNTSYITSIKPGGGQQE